MNFEYFPEGEKVFETMMIKDDDGNEIECSFKYGDPFYIGMLGFEWPWYDPVCAALNVVINGQYVTLLNVMGFAASRLDIARREYETDIRDQEAHEAYISSPFKTGRI